MFNRIAIGLLVAVVSMPVFADGVSAVTVQDQVLGTGVPGASGVQETYALPDGVYHAPQYLPGSPTAATIYPRVVEVNCTKNADGSLNCEGYHWLPEMGRAEYLLVKPRVVEAPKPVIVEKVVTVIKEVPAKKIRE